jgi:uncharacterized protein
MTSKLLHQHAGQRTFALVFDAGDEMMRVLLEFCRRERLSASHFTAIGAFQRVTVAFFDWSTKAYQEIAIEEQVEVLTLAGDVTLKDGAPHVHAHVVVGKADATAHGGHLVEGIVRPTIELILIESPVHLKRRLDTATGLALLDL